MRKCSPWSIKDEGEKLRNEPYEYLLFLKIHTEMKKLVSFVIKIDWEFVSLSNNPPSHCISLNSFSQTLLLIISFPSYTYNLHILIHPLACQHILKFLDSLHLLLLTLTWVPWSLTPPPPTPPKGFPVAWSLTFTDTPLGSPKMTLGLLGTGNATTVVQLLVATATDLLLDAGLWLAAADRGVGQPDIHVSGDGHGGIYPHRAGCQQRKIEWISGRKGITATSEGVFASNTECFTYLHWILYVQENICLRLISTSFNRDVSEQI